MHIQETEKEKVALRSQVALKILLLIVMNYAINHAFRHEIIPGFIGGFLSKLIAYKTSIKSAKNEVMPLLAISE